MTQDEITRHLETIVTAPDVAARSAEITNGWRQAGVQLESVERVLRFMEEHADLDYGSPGPLVHFVESFHGRGYEARLVESVNRKPTFHTVWMLNRLINGTKDPEARKRFIATMENVGQHPQSDHMVRDQANEFLERFRSL